MRRYRGGSLPDRELKTSPRNTCKTDRLTPTSTGVKCAARTHLCCNNTLSRLQFVHHESTFAEQLSNADCDRGTTQQLSNERTLPGGERACLGRMQRAVTERVELAIASQSAAEERLELAFTSQRDSAERRSRTHRASGRFAKGRSRDFAAIWPRLGRDLAMSWPSLGRDLQIGRDLAETRPRFGRAP